MSAGSPAVSVVTATYNRSGVLAYAIRSVLAQSFADFEYLVVGECVEPGFLVERADVVPARGEAPADAFAGHARVEQQPHGVGSCRWTNG